MAKGRKGKQNQNSSSNNQQAKKNPKQQPKKKTVETSEEGVSSDDDGDSPANVAPVPVPAAGRKGQNIQASAQLGTTSTVPLPTNTPVQPIQNSNAGDVRPDGQ